MKALLAVISCHSRPDFSEVIRETWLPQVPSGVDCKFFLGPSAHTPKADEIFLDCDDTYAGLPSKVQALFIWALQRGYDHVLKCDDDVVLKPMSLLSSGFEQHQFVGRKNMDAGTIDAPWGFCYWVDKEAMEIMTHTSLPSNNNDEVWIAHTLYSQGISLKHDDRYYVQRALTRKEQRRALRLPKGHTLPAAPVEGTFAYCMYIRGAGREAIISQFKTTFQEIQKT